MAKKNKKKKSKAVRVPTPQTTSKPKLSLAKPNSQAARPTPQSTIRTQVTNQSQPKTPSLADLVRTGGSTLQSAITEAKQIQSQGHDPNKVRSNIVSNAFHNAPPPPTLAEIVTQGGQALQDVKDTAQAAQNTVGGGVQFNNQQVKDIIGASKGFGDNKRAEEAAAAKAQADSEMITFYPPGSTTPITMTPEQFFESMKDPAFKDLVGKSSQEAARPIQGGAVHAINNGLIKPDQLVWNEETGMLELPPGFDADGNKIQGDVLDAEDALGKKEGELDNGTKVPGEEDIGLFELFSQMSPEKRAEFANFVNNKLVGGSNPQDTDKLGADPEQNPNTPLDEELIEESAPVPEEAFSDAFSGAFSQRGTVSGPSTSPTPGITNLGRGSAPAPAPTDKGFNSVGSAGISEIAAGKIDEGAGQLQSELRFNTSTEVPDTGEVIGAVDDLAEAYDIGEHAERPGTVNITDSEGNIIRSISYTPEKGVPKLGKGATKKIENYLNEQADIEITDADGNPVDIEIDLKKTKNKKDNTISKQFDEDWSSEDVEAIVNSINEAFLNSPVDEHHQLRARVTSNKKGQLGFQIDKTAVDFRLDFNQGGNSGGDGEGGGTPGGGGLGDPGTFTDPGDDDETVVEKEDDAMGNYFDTLSDDFFGDGGIVDIVRGTTEEQGETFGVANEQLRAEIENLDDPTIKEQVTQELDVLKARGQEQLRNSFVENMRPLISSLRGSNALSSNFGRRMISQMADDVLNKGVLELTRELDLREREIKNDIVSRKLEKIKTLSGVEAPEIPERLPFFQNVPGDRLPEQVSFKDMFGALKVFAKDVPEATIGRMAEFLTKFLNNSVLVQNDRGSGLGNAADIAQIAGAFF